MGIDIMATAKKMKATVKKAKTTAKKVTVKTAKASDTTAKRIKTVKEPFTKGALLNEIMERVNALQQDKPVNRKTVSVILETMFELAAGSLKKGGAGKFNIPDICMLVAQDKPAVKARKGRNPFTGEEMMFKAKPASRKVRIRPLKKLKDATSGAN
jgi:nucleoid DNA-binding protein